MEAVTHMTRLTQIYRDPTTLNCPRVT